MLPCYYRPHDEQSCRSLCTPARFSLLTGRFAANASSIVAHRPWNYVGFNTFLTRAEPTVAEVLAARRNYTCLAFHDVDLLLADDVEKHPGPRKVLQRRAARARRDLAPCDVQEVTRDIYDARL